VLIKDWMTVTGSYHAMGLTVIGNAFAQETLEHEPGNSQNDGMDAKQPPSSAITEEPERSMFQRFLGRVVGNKQPLTGQGTANGQPHGASAVSLDELTASIAAMQASTDAILAGASGDLDAMLADVPVGAQAAGQARGAALALDPALDPDADVEINEDELEELEAELADLADEMAAAAGDPAANDGAGGAAPGFEGGQEPQGLGGATLIAHTAVHEGAPCANSVVGGQGSMPAPLAPKLPQQGVGEGGETGPPPPAMPASGADGNDADGGVSPDPGGVAPGPEESDVVRPLAG
jgi:hypothetical protein